MTAQNNSQQTGEKKYRGWVAFWKVVKIAVALIGLTGAGLSIFQGYRWLGSNPYIKVDVIDNQCLTRIESIPDLKCSYNFKGRSVNSLWVSRMLLMNSCQRNIIGTSYHDLMSTNIVLRVSDNYKIISVDVERNDFDANIVGRENSVSFDFRKWRPEESCLINVYSEGLENDQNGPSFSEAFESFAQGKLEIFEHQTPLQNVSLIKCLPHWLIFVIKWLGIVVYVFLLGLCFWGFFINIHWIRLFKRWRWNKKYLVQVEEVLKSANITENANSVNINRLPHEFWIQHKIPKPPKDSDYVKRTRINYSDITAIGILCLIGTVLSLISLAGLLCI